MAEQKLSPKQESRLNSRKFWLTIGTLATVTVTDCLAAWWPAFQVSLDTVIGAQVSVITLYFRANNVGKWLSKAKEPKEERSPKARTRASDKDAKDKEVDVPQGE